MPDIPLRRIAAVVVLSLAIGGAAAVAALPAVASADPADCRSIPVEADAPVRSAIARESYGVDGTGVTIGLISDSYGASTVITSPADDVAAGLLPGAGNPCGRTSPVRVLTDDPAGHDEGRAMLQIVHGIAPGAALMFASAGAGQVQDPVVVAAAIDALAAAGADIIVDDIGFPEGLRYQQGLVSDAVERAKAAGILTFTSAGNGNVVGAPGGDSAGRPIGSWSTTSYRPIACPSWVTVDAGSALDCLDFDPAPGADDPTDRIEMDDDPGLYLHWGEPYGGVASAFELQVYREDAGGADPVRVSTMEQTDPAVNPVGSVILPAAPPHDVYDLVVVRTRAAPDGALPAVGWLAYRSGLGILAAEYDASDGPDVVGPTAMNHAADGSALGVGAARFSTPTQMEDFSAIGPSTLLFAPVDAADPTSPAAALPAPVRAAGPRVTGVDGMRTSFFGEASTEGGATVYRFYGTSAASPVAAAVVALARQYDPGLTPDALPDLFARTSAAVANPYAAFGFADEDVSGAGLIDAAALLAALPVPSGPVPAAPAVLAESGSGDGWRPLLATGAGALVVGALLLRAARGRRRRS
jgi:hypothetical protein